ncbi:MAG: hypothetical protein HDR24_07325 [Lachnospiraceae bacterium]|nr:hypothetical protein [Lachnospiraceae bacterium]
MKLYRLSEEQYYMGNSPTSLYLFSSHTIEELKKYNLICFGVGIMMQLAKLELKKMDLSFMGYADNDPWKQGKKVGKVEVVQPSYYFGKQVHFVICVKEHSLNAVRVQLEANGIHDYSICCETFDYIDSDNTFNQLTQKSAEQIAEHYSMPIKPYYYKGRPLGQIWYSICSVRFWHPAAKWLLSSIDDEDEVLEIGAGGNAF